MKYSGPNIVILDHVVTCLGVKRPDLGLFGASKQLALLMKRPFGSFLRAQKVQKWVIDNHLVTIGQLDHNVGLEPNLAQYKTSRGAKSALYESNRPPLTHLEPPKLPKTPPNYPKPAQ